MEGLRDWNVAVVLRRVLGREVGTAVTTEIPCIAVGEGICPPDGKLMDPLLVGNVPLDVVLAGVTETSFSSTVCMSSRDASATAVLTASAIMPCTVRKAACPWSFVCSWPPVMPTGLAISEGFTSIRLERDRVRPNWSVFVKIPALPETGSLIRARPAKAPVPLRNVFCGHASVNNL